MKLLRWFLFGLGSLSCLHAQTVGLTFDTGSFIVKASNNVTALSGGTTADGDGFAFQIGYYSAATNLNPFAGTWNAITGNSSANTAFNSLSIGDYNAQGGGNGTVFLGSGIVFDLSNSATSTLLPAAGQIMAVRFYNATVVSSATYYGAASAGSGWVWTAPNNTPPTPMTFSLDDANVVWQGGFTGFTGIAISAIPEPSTYAALFGAAALGLAVWRKRRKSA